MLFLPNKRLAHVNFAVTVLPPTSLSLSLSLSLTLFLCVSVADTVCSRYKETQNHSTQNPSSLVANIQKAKPFLLKPSPPLFSPTFEKWLLQVQLLQPRVPPSPRVFTFQTLESLIQVFTSLPLLGFIYSLF